MKLNRAQNNSNENYDSPLENYFPKLEFFGLHVRKMCAICYPLPIWTHTNYDPIGCTMSEICTYFPLQFIDLIPEILMFVGNWNIFFLFSFFLELNGKHYWNVEECEDIWMDAWVCRCKLFQMCSNRTARVLNRQRFLSLKLFVIWDKYLWAYFFLTFRYILHCTCFFC